MKRFIYQVIGENMSYDFTIEGIDLEVLGNGQKVIFDKDKDDRAYIVGAFPPSVTVCIKNSIIR